MSNFDGILTQSELIDIIHRNEDEIRYLNIEIENRNDWLVEWKKCEYSIKELSIALERAIHCMRDDAEAIDAEWGDCRSIDKIISEGDAPHIVHAIETLKNFGA